MGDVVTLVIDGRETTLTVCGSYSDVTHGGKSAKAVFSDPSADIIWTTWMAEKSSSTARTCRRSSGQDYAHPDMGALPVVLDNLLAGGVIRPVLAVFIDTRDPATGSNRRESLLVANDRFQQFLIAELVPAIDQAYRTRAAADGRVILGTSLGGLHAAYTGAHRSSVFGMAAIYSPYFRAHPQVLADFTASERLPLQVFMMQGICDSDVANTRQWRNFHQ